MTQGENTVEIPEKAIERVIKELETGMRQGEIAHQHKEMRPSTVMMAQAHQDAYRALIRAHPDYELTKGDQ